jgi:hypothetical protein
VSTRVQIVVVGNIRSTPRMSRKEERAAVQGLFAWADKLDADFVFGCEIDHHRLRRIWKNRARAHGFSTSGAVKGSENTVSFRDSGWTQKSFVVRFISKGLASVSPNRTVSVADVADKGAAWNLQRLMSTHLVSQWQEYARDYATHWSYRNMVGRRSVRRLGRQIDAGLAKGYVCVLGGDMNALVDIKFDEEQVQLVGVEAKARNNLGKMMQVVAIAPHGKTVRRIATYTQAPVATDHPYRAAKYEVTQ